MFPPSLLRFILVRDANAFFLWGYPHRKKRYNLLNRIFIIRWRMTLSVANAKFKGTIVSPLPPYYNKNKHSRKSCRGTDLRLRYYCTKGTKKEPHERRKYAENGSLFRRNPYHAALGMLRLSSTPRLIHEVLFNCGKRYSV